MKKIVIVLALAALVPAFTSCKKTCSCTITTKSTVTDPSMQGEVPSNFMDGTATGTQETMGKCSDLNNTVTQNMIWYKVDQITECK